MKAGTATSRGRGARVAERESRSESRGARVAVRPRDEAANQPTNALYFSARARNVSTRICTSYYASLILKVLRTYEKRVFEKRKKRTLPR